MLRINNGTPQQCAYNLLKLQQGEVPFARLKGLTTATVDMPADEAAENLQEQALWLIETYEPRLTDPTATIETVFEESTAFSSVNMAGTINQNQEA